MTTKILKSQIGSDFATRVEAFRLAKLAHHHTVNMPAPVEHHMVEACVCRVPVAGSADDYKVDYEIVDDTPPPPTLDELKTKLLQQVAGEEGKALAAVSPPGKRRLLTLQLQDILAKPAADVTAADQAAIAAYSATQQKVDTISRHAAELSSAIEDLTTDTIGAWVMTPFPTV